MSMLYAFADESLRPGRCLMGVVLVEPEQAGALRRKTSHLRLPGQQRLRFQSESPERRHELLDAILDFDVQIFVFDRHKWHDESDADARFRCLTAMVQHLQGLDRDVFLYLKHQNRRDDEDRETIEAARSPGAVVSYQHLDPASDPLLWLPNCFLWPLGAGGDWLGRVRPAITSLAEGA